MSKNLIQSNSKSKNFFTWFVVIFLFLFIKPILLNAQTDESSQLNSNYRRTVRVGYYTSPGFQDYDERTGAYSGSGYEYLLAIAQYANWNLEFVHTGFAEAVSMLQNNELDLVNNVSITEARLKTLAFSQHASGSNCGWLVVNKDNTTYAHNDFEEFNNMTVGIYATSIFIPYFKEFCTKHKINPKIVYYKSDVELVDAIKNGEIDARVVSSSYDKWYRTVAEFAPMDYYFAVPINENKLIEELDAAMESLSNDLPNFITELKIKYSSNEIDENIVFSKKEKEYIKNHESIRVGYAEHWRPISYTDENGNFAGALSKIYARLSEITGLNFEFVPHDYYPNLVKNFKAGGISVISEFPYDFIFASEWNARLTPLVYQIPVYRVTHHLDPANEIKKIGITNRMYLNKTIKNYYGENVEYIQYENESNAVEALMNQEIDCVHMNSYQTHFFQSAVNIYHLITH